ncbi:MAG: YbbR-like domain-containing protein [SAR324 cluster bacterium]|nr:YbbR-like domain-containing protein [SAR324 cluster bacterium]
MKSVFKGLLFNNPLQKLLALSFAITIWIFAPAPDKKNLTEIQFFVPVSYVNLPKNLEIISDPLRSISVSVEIPTNEIQKAHPSMFQAVIDLEDATPGNLSYELNQKIIKVQDTINVTITQISPSSMDLVFEEVIEKTIPIKPVFVGEVSKGYVLEKVTMEPESVTIRGPKSIAEKIEQAETKAINIEKADNHMELLASLSLPKTITVIEPTKEYYVARIRIGSEPINVRFLQIPIGIVNQTYVTQINPRYFNVLLRGPRSLMENFTKEDIQAIIDVEDMRPGEKKKIKAPTLRMRPEIKILEIWPPIDIWVKPQRID